MSFCFYYSCTEQIRIETDFFFKGKKIMTGQMGGAFVGAGRDVVGEELFGTVLKSDQYSSAVMQD